MQLLALIRGSANSRQRLQPVDQKCAALAARKIECLASIRKQQIFGHSENYENSDRFGVVNVYVLSAVSRWPYPADGAQQSASSQ
ncbi:hypothetical protein, partial [Staphylococcus aureus]|uniref:hypothetical protein n=1 Tax=Staphylococcus aureus TaxID=1280 RepID=UPI001C531886